MIRAAVVLMAALLWAGAQPVQAEDDLASLDTLGDVRPSDWAYQALADLVQQHRCGASAAIASRQTVTPKQPLSRFEAAALLQACLETIQRPTDALKRLQGLFAVELEQLVSQHKQLQSRLNTLDAQVFSPTTRLALESFWIAGGNSFNGNAINSASNTYGVPAGSGATVNAPLLNALSFNYDIRLNLSTSWTGKDLLYTRLRAGNFYGSGFGTDPYNNMATLDASYGIGPIVRIDRLYYKFPVGDSVSVMVGPRVRNTEILGFRPQAYDGILDFFTLAGAPTVYNKANGAGAGFSWKQKVTKDRPYWIAAISYVAELGELGDPAFGGLFNANGANNVNLQLGGRGSNWAVAAGYRYGTCFTDSRSGTALVMAPGTLYCNWYDAPGNNASSHSFGLGGYWQPPQNGWMPAISLGWGYSRWNQSTALISDPRDSAVVSATQSWAAMLQWNGVGSRGDAAGLAVGQGTLATALRTGATPNDSNFAFEGWYRFRVSDAISITPAVFYLVNPAGQVLAHEGLQLNNLGLLIQTRFQF